MIVPSFSGDAIGSEFFFESGHSDDDTSSFNNHFMNTKDDVRTKDGGDSGGGDDDSEFDSSKFPNNLRINTDLDPEKYDPNDPHDWNRILPDLKKWDKVGRAKGEWDPKIEEQLEKMQGFWKPKKPYDPESIVIEYYQLKDLMDKKPDDLHLLHAWINQPLLSLKKHPLVEGWEFDQRLDRYYKFMEETGHIPTAKPYPLVLYSDLNTGSYCSFPTTEKFRELAQKNDWRMNDTFVCYDTSGYH